MWSEHFTEIIYDHPPLDSTIFPVTSYAVFQVFAPIFKMVDWTVYTGRNDSNFIGDLSG